MLLEDVAARGDDLGRASAWANRREARTEREERGGEEQDNDANRFVGVPENHGRGAEVTSAPPLHQESVVNQV